MNTLLRKVLYSVPLTLSYALAATAQVATGAYAYGTYDNKGFDTINVGSLNDHFSIPVINKAGRGLPFYYNLSYDSSVWFPTSVNGATTWTPVANFGWRGDTEIATGYISHNTISLTAEVPPTKGGIATKCPYTIYDEFVYHDTLGASHPF